MKINMSQERKILLGSIAAAVALVSVFTLITQEIAVIVNVSVIAMFVLIGPIFFYKYMHFLWVKSVEKQFPSFIRDLASLSRSGMSLSEGVRMCVKSNYGKLSPEVEKFANRLSWGTSFHRALDIFGETFKDSSLITEVVAIIKESYISGGNISRTLDSLSDDMLMLKEIDQERKSIVKSHMMLMYGIFYMFVGVSISIIYVLIPMMTSTDIPSSSAAQTPLMFNFADPCESFALPFPCGFFQIICISFGVPSGVGCYYLALFFSVLMIQAIFMGLIAGQLGENSAIAGIKHSLIMLASVFLIFTFMMQAHLLPIGASILPTPGANGSPF